MKAFFNTKIALVIILFSGVSCTKSYCWQCMTQLNIIATGQPTQYSKSESSVCDKTEKEIRDYEKAGSKQTTATTGGVTVTYIYTTQCKH
jgi:hypothetical protein